MPRHVRHNRRTRRNPQVFGTKLTGKTALVGVGGMIGGIALVKMVAPMLPATLTSSTFIKAVSAAGLALVAGWGIGKMNPDLGGAVLLGGLAEAVSIGLGGMLPITQYTGLSGGRGMGVYAPSTQLLPNNPLQNMPGGLLAAGGPNNAVYGNHGIYSRRAAA
jgi:hypothetical protein